ncbi:MAG TPA: HK97 gp10 family phage protein [Candidatus Paceibacterota bacterium]
MAVIQLEASQLGARMRSDANGGPKAVQRAMFSAAQRGKAYIVGKTPVDRGFLRNAWRVIKSADSVELINDQPYAGIMELGARPFKISSAGVWALKAWVMRMFKSGRMTPQGAQHKISWKRGWDKRLATATGGSQINKITKKRITKDQLEQQAESIAWAIAKTFEKVGMKGKRFVFANLPQLAELMDAEISRSLGKFFNRGSGDQ